MPISETLIRPSRTDPTKKEVLRRILDKGEQVIVQHSKRVVPPNPIVWFTVVDERTIKLFDPEHDGERIRDNVINHQILKTSKDPQTGEYKLYSYISETALRDL